jgi:hypothetical protein
MDKPSADGFKTLLDDVLQFLVRSSPSAAFFMAGVKFHHHYMDFRIVSRLQRAHFDFICPRTMSRY